jgi:uncharacterized protein YndB with AHSA1/START domain
MPSFADTITTTAAPAEVWKLLYDPSRFPDWWSGIGTVDVGDGDGDGGSYTMYPDGYPDFPMAQVLQSRREDRRVTVSCMVSDLRFEWVLEEVAGGTRINVEVEIPEAEAHRLATQQQVISASLAKLGALAAA